MSELAPAFDVFLSYNSQDRTAVRQLAEALKGRGLLVWLDEEEISPGAIVQEVLEQGILASRAAAVLVGPSGIGPWEKQEMRACITLAVEREMTVIPVLLPGVSAAPALPLLLKSFSWLDARAGLTVDSLARLERGIRQAKPHREPALEPPPPDPLVETYTTWAKEQFRFLDLLGVGGRDVKLRFEEVFVPLRMAQRRGDEARWGKEGLAREAFEDVEVSSLFTVGTAGEPHRLILGDPGAGKTTVLQKLHHQLCTEGPEALGLLAGTVPLFLRLRSFPAVLPATPEELLSRQLDQAAGEGRLPAELGAHLWRRGRLLLLLDGLDELSDEDRRTAVCRFLDRHLPAAEARGVRAVFSCRFTGYGGRVALSPRFLPFEVRPLGPEGCRQLVLNWFREAPRALPNFSDGDALAAQDRLLTALDGPAYAAQRLKVLVGSPLLLTLLCLIVLRGGQLPKERVAFYDQCLRLLLSQWNRSRAEQAGETATEPPLDVEAALAVLRFAAWEVQAEGRLEDLPDIGWIDRLERGLEAMGRSGVPGEAIFDWLHREAGVLAELAVERYGFRHLGLQEYLAAHHAASHGGEFLDRLADHFGEEGWVEIPLLAVGQPGLRAFRPLVERLLAKNVLAERADLLRACLEEAAEVELAPFFPLLEPGADPERQAAVLRLLRGQMDPALLERAERLAQSGDTAVADLAAQVLREGRAVAGATPWDLVLVVNRETSEDARAAAALIDALQRGGLRVALLPDDRGEKLKVLRASRGLAVAIGPSGRGPWDAPTFAFDLRIFARQQRPLLGIRLPGSGEISSLPEALSAADWLDLRGGLGGVAATMERALTPLVSEAAAPAKSSAGLSPTTGEAWTEAQTGIRFLWIPGGRFQMGGTIDDDEKPIHWVRVSPFWLGETPVTNAQYGVFLKQAGDKEVREPAFWRDRRFSAPEQPVVGVSWTEAIEYCEWLSRVSGKRVTLPSEAQWEFAARGTDGREYPWGDETPDGTRACFGLELDNGQPAAVGSFPAGRGPFGPLDQAGNVWEWCLDRWDENVYRKRAVGPESVDPWVPGDRADVSLVRVVRGGCWVDPSIDLRASYRGGNWARIRVDSIGFRVAAFTPGPSPETGEGNPLPPSDGGR